MRAPAHASRASAFDHIAGPDLRCGARPTAKTLDGILLSLHGAMVTEFCEDGEGELLRRIRAIAGPDMPIAVSWIFTPTARR